MSLDNQFFPTTKRWWIIWKLWELWFPIFFSSALHIEVLRLHHFQRFAVGYALFFFCYFHWHNGVFFLLLCLQLSPWFLKGGQECHLCRNWERGLHFGHFEFKVSPTHHDPNNVLSQITNNVPTTSRPIKCGLLAPNGRELPKKKRGAHRGDLKNWL